MATPEEQVIIAELAVAETAETHEAGQMPALSVARVAKFFAGFITLRESVKTQLAPKLTQTAAAVAKETQDRATADTASGVRIDQLETRVRALEQPPPP